MTAQAPNGADGVALRHGLSSALAAAGLPEPEVSVDVVAELPPPAVGQAAPVRPAALNGSGCPAT